MKERRARPLSSSLNIIKIYTQNMILNIANFCIKSFQLKYKQFQWLKKQKISWLHFFVVYEMAADNKMNFTNVTGISN